MSESLLIENRLCGGSLARQKEARPTSIRNIRGAVSSRHTEFAVFRSASDALDYTSGGFEQIRSRGEGRGGGEARHPHRTYTYILTHGW